MFDQEERMSMPVRIFVADDHEIVREGVKSLLKARPEWVVCGEASNGTDAIRALQNMACEAAIIDITMPGNTGLDVAKEISRRNSNVKILIFTMHDSKGLIRAAKDAGARGMVMKSYAARDLIRALEIILGGGQFFGPDGADKDDTPKGFGHILLCLQAPRLIPA
jgi:DNA-binding NarL/FixJ family response regulator